MGCAASKLDDLPAVALCRDRCNFLDEAVRQRFAFAEAHAAYLRSLRSVGLSLDRFFNHDLDGLSALVPQSPVLNRKGGPDPPGSPPDKFHHHLHSHSSSGSHLHFDSDDDDDDDEKSAPETLRHHDVSSYGGGYIADYQNFNFNQGGGGGGGGGGAGFMKLNYMKNQATPSVVYTQRPVGSETMHMGESSASSSSYYPNYGNNQNQNYNSNNNLNGYPNYGGGGGGGYFGGSSPPAPYNAVASSSKPPPPPPSPPRSSTWDFLNPFETFEKYYPPYTSSRDSREVRDEEGIPELEDEEDEVVVKEVHGNQKFVVDSKRKEDLDLKLQHKAKPSVVGVESDPVEYEVHMVQKKVADDSEEKSKDRGGLNKGSGDLEVLREIQLQFERASESGSDLAKFLEVGKLPYKRKHAGYHVSSKILHLPGVSSQPSTDSAQLDVDQDLELRSTSLSSTLHKLHIWEKKLYEEVKVEEKMRVLHERKSRKLKRMDESGAETQKVEKTRALVRSLSTKITIAIQVVDKISVKINSLRDEELWPQLNELIQQLATMWKSMLDCYQNQCRAIAEAKQLKTPNFSDAQFEATRQLEHDLINWTLGFSHWVGAQKGCIRALNNWLMKCLLYVPEETPDGIVPFSPGRIGAPPVFVVCNQWSQLLDTISEKEVVDTMRDFASNVLQLWDRDKAEMRQRMLANKDERKIKSLEKEDQRIQKEIQSLDKKMMGLSNVVYQSETIKGGGSLQTSLQRVLEAMERFTDKSSRVYEELLERIKEDRFSRESEQVS